MRPLLITALAIAALPFAALAQQEATIRATSTLMEVEVQVVDGKGQPIEGLTAEDFQLSENGDPQEIRAFEFIDVPREIASSQPKSAAPDPGAETSQGNPVEAPGTEPLRIFIATQVGEAERPRTRQAIRKFIEKDMPAGALVSIDGSPFLSDPETLLEILEAAPINDAMTGNPINDQPFEPVLEPPPGEDLSAEDLLAGRRFRSDRQSSSDRSDLIARSLLERYVGMIRSLRMYPGKKMLVLFARGFPWGFDSSRQRFLTSSDPRMLEAIRAESVRARISLYIVDARGLDVGAQITAGNSDGQRPEALYSMRQGAEGVPGFLNARRPVSAGLDDNFRARQQGLQVIAEQTGGVAVLNTNNVGEIFDKLKEDLGGYYLLGYYLPEAENRTETRKIKVETSGVQAKLRYRSEFYDDAKFTAILEEEYRDRLTKAMGPAPDPAALDAPVAALEAYQSAQEQLGSPLPKLALAQADLQKAVELYPAFSTAWNLLGYVRERSNDTDGAIEAYQAAAKATPDYLRPHAHLARLALGRQQWSEALDHAQKILDADATDAEAAYYIAVAHHSAGDLEQAGRAAEAAIESGAAKEFPNILQLRGLIQAGQGDFEAAIASYRRYLAENPEAVDAKFVEEQIGYWQSAPDLLALREAVENEDWASADERSRSLLAVDSELEEARYYGAVSAYQLGDYERAVELGEALLASADGQAYPQLHRMLGVVYAEQGRLDDAARRYRSFLALQPDAEDAPTLQRQLATWEKSKRYQQSGGPGLRIINRYGNLIIRSRPNETLAMQASSPSRELADGDVVAFQEGSIATIESRPADRARTDLELIVPYGQAIEAVTGAGSITLEGLFYAIDAQTETGAVHLQTPWRATALDFETTKAPKVVNLPPGELLRQQDGPDGWSLTTAHAPMAKTYGRITIHADAPAEVTATDQPIPADSPIKMPWQAPEVIEAVLSADLQQPAASNATSVSTQPSEATFSTDVRLVSLSVAVMGQDGSAVLDLQPDDFRVLEDGQPQRIEAISAGTAPFNLALLLDISGSTIEDRAAIKLAARRLIATARPIDRVALYTLGDEMFAVASELTSEYSRLVDALEAIPPLTGGSPLYDAIALAWAQELRYKTGQRNALVVLTDGVDNRLAVQYYEQPKPNPRRGKPPLSRPAPPGVKAAQSNLSFEQLLAGVQRMDALIYPFLLARTDEGRIFPGQVEDRAREQMQQLAAAAGARVIIADTIDDATPFHDLVRDLRSVYTISYRPQNPTLDGEWRSVEVQVDNPELEIRTRPGYFAR